MSTTSTSPDTDAWGTVLGRVAQLEQRPAAYGVAVECALDDLRAGALRGRPLAPLLAAAARAGCSSEDIFHALGEVRGAGAQAPPL